MCSRQHALVSQDWLKGTTSNVENKYFLTCCSFLCIFCPAGEPGDYAEAAFGDGHRAPAPVRLQLAAERILGRGRRPRHHEQPAGRD